MKSFKVCMYDFRRLILNPITLCGFIIAIVACVIAGFCFSPTITPSLSLNLEYETADKLYQEFMNGNEEDSLTNLNLVMAENQSSTNYSQKAIGGLIGFVGSGVLQTSYSKLNVISLSAKSAGGLVGECMDIEGENISGGYIRSCGIYNGHSINLVEASVIIYNSNPTGGFIAKLCDTANISISNCYAINENLNGGRDNVLARGINRVGGFVAVCDNGANVAIQNCFSYGSIRSESKTIAVGNKDTFGGFVGINSSSRVNIQYCYAFVQLDYDSGWINDYIDARAFGCNDGGGNFSNNYCLSQDTGNSSGANHELNANDFHSQSAFGEFDFNGVWSMENIENVTNIPVSNQCGVQVLADDNSTIRILKEDGGEISNTIASEVNLSGLAYGNYKVEITRYGQNVSYSFTLSADNKFSNIFDKAFYSGEGTETSPYIITNQGQFESVGNSNAFFVLKNNINAFGDMITPNGTFSGNFDGNGKKIYNFSINSSSENVGLFETLSNANVKNLEISSFLVASQNSSNTGALAGKIANSQIENVTLDFGEIVGDSGNIGGLAGEIAGTTISKTKSNVNITTSSQNGFAGGMVGVATGASTISLSFSSGKITGLNNLGGFVGNAENVAIQNSYTTSSVAGETNDASTSVIGGFAGNISANSSISTSFMYGSVESLNGLGNVGVFAGENNSSNLQNNYAWNVNNYKIVFSGSGNGVSFLSTTDFAEQSSFAGFDFTDIWTLENSNYPLLKSA